MKTILCVIFILSVMLYTLPTVSNAKTLVYVENVDLIRKEQRQVLNQQLRENYVRKQAMQKIIDQMNKQAEEARLKIEASEKARELARKEAEAKKAQQQIKNSITGYAPHYSPGVMERVSKVRKMPLVNCMVSSPYEKIGTWLKVTSLIDGDSLDCRVTDVSHPRDRARHIASNWAVELDWNSAQILCNISRVGQEPPRKCPVNAVVLSR